MTDSQKERLTLHGFDVVDRSLIKLVPKARIELPDYDWLFFSSVNGSRIFLKNHPIPSDKKIAAVGAKTADYLTQNGLSVHFIGEGNDTSKIGASFGRVASNDVVLFPCSDKSRGNIQKALSDHAEVKEVHTYSTHHDSAIIGDCNIYVFTSPMNVESFLSKNNFPDKATIWTIGTSTGEALSKAGINYQVAPKSSVDSIIDQLLKL